MKNLQNVRDVQEFFTENSLLRRACKELNLSYQTVYNQLDRMPHRVRNDIAENLYDWICLWKMAEKQRQELSRQVLGKSE